MKTESGNQSGFTLLEMMIVVTIVGMLAVLAVPTVMRARQSAENARFAADLHTASSAFEEYSIAWGRYPADEIQGVVPTGMDDYLTKVHWTAINSIGGMWEWDYRQFGVTAGVSVFQPAAKVEQMERVDALLDDGNLTTGTFRSRASGYISIIED